MTPLRQHVERWRDCQRCELCDGRIHVVLCRGEVPCDVLFVGEAPGESENALGVPFVGPAGKLLDSIIDGAVRRSESWDEGGFVAVRFAFTNLVCCIPRDESNGRAKLSEPPERAIKTCRPRLVEFVRMARPRLIVLVGALAKRHVSGQFMFCFPGENDQPPWIAEGDFLRFADIVHPAAILRANLAQQGLMRQRCEVVLANALEELA